MQGLHPCAALGRSLLQLQPPFNESAICYLSRPQGEVSIWSRLQPGSFKSLNTRSQRSPPYSPGTVLQRGRLSSSPWTLVCECVFEGRGMLLLYLGLTLCLCLSLCLCFSSVLSLARAHIQTEEALQPMPKCHLKSKCNNLLWKRPRSREIPCSEQPPPLLHGVLGVGDRQGIVNLAGGDDQEWCSSPLPLPGPCRN